MTSGETAPSVRMQGYVSQFASVESEWPDAYVIVQTSPDHWMATLPLGELVSILDRKAFVPLREIPYRWLGDDLVVEFGPVHVRGDTPAWLTLARRVLGAAGSTSGLFEVPGTRPWGGPAVEVSVRRVLVGDEPAGESESAQDGELTADTRLALTCGMSNAEFQEIFGWGWRTWPGHPKDPESLFSPSLFFWGEPPQLGAELSEDGTLRIGEPAGEWWGPGEVTMHLDLPTVVGPETPRPLIEAYVREVLRRRRRKFSWCRRCGRQVPPEEREHRDLCYGCGEGEFEMVIH